MTATIQRHQTDAARAPRATQKPARRLPGLGRRVRIERDEARYPSRGTWPQYRDRIGTVIAHNLGEAGVSFGKRRHIEAWFLPHELTELE